MAIVLFLLGMVTAWVLFVAAVWLLFRRGSWELERYERDGLHDDGISSC